MKLRLVLIALHVILIASCTFNSPEVNNNSSLTANKESDLNNDNKSESESETDNVGLPYDTSAWKDMSQIIPSARMDIRYATANNFMGKVIYDCPACLLRKEAAMALTKAAALLEKEGLGLLIFDCYRPAPYQQRLWDVMPDKRYVAPPEKGSNHSRGMAIDLTLFNLQSGAELDMGTTYDFFGREAHPDYKGFPPGILENRARLSSVMMQVGFTPITSEWWHFDFKGKNYEVSDFLWNCPYE